MFEESYCRNIRVLLYHLQLMRVTHARMCVYICMICMRVCAEVGSNVCKLNDDGAGVALNAVMHWVGPD